MEDGAHATRIGREETRVLPSERHHIHRVRVDPRGSEVQIMKIARRPLAGKLELVFFNFHVMVLHRSGVVICWISFEPRTGITMGCIPVRDHRISCSGREIAVRRICLACPPGNNIGKCGLEATDELVIRLLGVVARVFEGIVSHCLEKVFKLGGRFANFETG